MKVHQAIPVSSRINELHNGINTSDLKFAHLSIELMENIGVMITNSKDGTKFIVGYPNIVYAEVDNGAGPGNKESAVVIGTQSKPEKHNKKKAV